MGRKLESESFAVWLLGTGCIFRRQVPTRTQAPVPIGRPALLRAVSAGWLELMEPIEGGSASLTGVAISRAAGGLWLAMSRQRRLMFSNSVDKESTLA